jgi:formamidopyrimidine-DNA glycosylase
LPGIIWNGETVPELPEVETVVREIRSRLVGKVIQSAHFARPRQLLPQTPRGLSRALKGQRISAVTRRGKFILIELERGTLLLHLRMTGRLHIRHSRERMDHETAQFVLESREEVLAFRDPRTLGTIRYYPVGRIIEPIANLGWEPLSDSVTPKMLKEKLGRRGLAIKPVLLDQSVWAGIGNIYASEALWEARIHPAKPANRLTHVNRQALIEAVPRVLNRALNKGGSTLRDFMSPEGIAGTYQKEFRAYGKEGEPCPRCKAQIKRIAQAQRSTYYCSKCQTGRKIQDAKPKIQKGRKKKRG